MRRPSSYLLGIVFVFSGWLLPITADIALAATGTIDSTYKYAWSDQGGWLNFGASNSNVVITDTAITGYVWSENFGWIHLAPSMAGVTNTTLGDVDGDAWGENTGYIDFSGVSINSSGEFIGYASNPVLGQISFNCLNTASCGVLDFKVKTDWLPTPVSTPGTSIQRLNGFQSSVTPVIGPVDVVSTDRIQYHWTYDGNGLGFRLLLPMTRHTILSIDDPTARAVTESGLPANSLVSGRAVIAYSGSQESLPSALFPDVYTLTPMVRPQLVSRSDATIRLGIDQSIPQLKEGQTGVQFQLIPLDSVNPSSLQTSPWVQEEQFVFSAIDPLVNYQARAKTRNQAGAETDWSEPLSIGIEHVVSPDVELLAGLQLTASSGQDLHAPLNPNDFLYAEMTVVNNGETPAQTVLLTLPLPDYILMIPGTMTIDGVRQSDAADEDMGQANAIAVSAIWPQVQYGFGHTVRFQLAFDTAALIRDFIKPLPTTSEPGIETLPGENFFDSNTRESQQLQQDRRQAGLEAMAQAIAALNPSIVLQSQASYSGDSSPVYSQAQQVEPQVDLLAAPLPLPTPIQFVKDVEVINDKEVQTIQQILQQQFPQPGKPTNQPSIPEGETSISTNGGRFSTDTRVGNQQLVVQGRGTPHDDQILFTGTTSAPFAVITLIFNGSVTVVTTADGNGNWQTYVSAEQLGIEPGQEKRVTVEAIASNGLLQSQRVPIADIVINRGQAGRVVAEFDTAVSEQGIMRALQKVTQTLQKNEPAVQTTLAVSAPVVIASSVPLWGYLPYAPTLFYHFLGLIFGSVARRKKKDNADTFGVVYDSITKLPLPLAIVRIYDRATNKLVTTTVTDKLGRYDVLLPAGQYRVEVGKPLYQFPSSIVTTTLDGQYDRVYSNKTGASISADKSALPHMPLDPINVKRQWEMAFGLRKLWLGFQRAGNHLATPLMLVGLVTALGMVYASPARSANWIMAGLYAATLAAQSKLKPKILKAWGVVYDMATDAILPLVTIQLIEPAGSKVVTSRLTDYEGRFTFLPEPGEYVVKASKPGFSQVTEVVQGYSDRQPLPKQIEITKPNQRIAGDIAMKQNSP